MISHYSKTAENSSYPPREGNVNHKSIYSPYSTRVDQRNNFRPRWVNISFGDFYSQHCMDNLLFRTAMYLSSVRTAKNSRIKQPQLMGSRNQQHILLRTQIAKFMGPWGPPGPLSAPDGSHVGPMNFAIRVGTQFAFSMFTVAFAIRIWVIGLHESTKFNDIAAKL